jgi:hypothetical protein
MFSIEKLSPPSLPHQHEAICCAAHLPLGLILLNSNMRRQKNAKLMRLMISVVEFCFAAPFTNATACL